MTELLLLLSLWPFHHKKPAVAPHYVEDHRMTLREDVDHCSRSGDVWFYTGDDKMTGISGASCEGAKDDWRTLHIDPVRMSRS